MIVHLYLLAGLGINAIALAVKASTVYPRLHQDWNTTRSIIIRDLVTVVSKPQQHIFLHQQETIL
jgi:hypothetical protein